MASLEKGSQRPDHILPRHPEIVRDAFEVAHHALECNQQYQRSSRVP